MVGAPTRRSPSRVDARAARRWPCRRRVLRGVLEQVRQRRPTQPRIDLDLGIVVGVDARATRPSSACRTCAIAASTISAGVDPLRGRRGSRRRRCAPCRGCPGTAASADSSSADRGARLLARAPSSGRSPRRFSTATRIAVSGVRRSWLSEASSADASSAFCRTSSAASRSCEELRALDRDRDDAGDRVERADVQLPPPRPAARWSWSHAAAEPARRDRPRLTRRSRARRSARCARRTRASPRAVASAVFRSRSSITTSSSAALVDRASPVIGRAGRSATLRQLEPPGDVARERVDRAGRLGRQQHVAASGRTAASPRCGARSPRAPAPAPPPTGCSRSPRRSGTRRARPSSADRRS